MHEDDPRRNSILGKANEYLTRAETLKTFLETSQPEGGSGSGGVAAASRPKGGEGGKDGGKGEVDAEKARMKAQLEGAIVTEKPNVSWDSVAGLEMAKAALQEAVVLPVRFPQLFTGEREPWKGILLYGPPGTGKSHIAR
jgi:vacuolar protein-sorting-associated protein 4